MRLEWGLALRPMPGQLPCGDAAQVWEHGGQVTVGVVDGLGHGAEAAKAADLALASLGASLDAGLEERMRHCHIALGTSRGAAVSLAVLDLQAGLMRWLGVGNVEGQLWHGPGRSSERLRTQNGIVGLALPALYPVELKLIAGDTLVFFTDGIKMADMDRLDWRFSAQDLATGTLGRSAKDNDDALVWIGRFSE